MGSRETCTMDERMRFVLAVEVAQEPMAVPCGRFGVIRKSGYKWPERRQQDGIAGLSDRSRAPLHHPQKISAAIAERCLAVRRVRCNGEAGSSPPSMPLWRARRSGLLKARTAFGRRIMARS